MIKPEPFKEYQKTRKILNEYGKKRTPILFIIDYECKSPIIVPLDEVSNKKIIFDIRGVKNYSPPQKGHIKQINLTKSPIEYLKYKRAFDYVQKELKKGNSYLLNLTFPTEISCNISPEDIFYHSREKYRLFYRDNFICFSPEQFIEIKNNKIFSCPMKGTIDAALKNAEKLVLSDEKEFAEHITIVDLIRNDLSMVAQNVSVEKFRFIQEVNTHDKTLLQVSSVIKGDLNENWQDILGDIITMQLPAGSVTGAPKKKTLEIIKEAEGYIRGYYTGIFGYFDGKYLDSAVMIRFIEIDKNQLIYKSGGGITIYSDCQKEYNELVDKVYVPIN